MDPQNRVTKLEEFRLGKNYCWKKGTTILPPQRCIEINFKERYVKFENDSGQDVRSHNFEHRYIEVGQMMEDKSLFPDLKGSAPINVLDARLKTYLRSRQRRQHNASCANCNFYDSTIGRCFHHANAVWGEVQPTEPDHWCVWWERGYQDFHYPN